MSTSTPTSTSDSEFTLEAKDMSRAAINGFRAAFGFGGVVAIILGIVLLVWPVRTVAVVAAVLGIFFIVSGIIRLGLGIFSSGTGASHRILNILVGLLLLIAGIVAVRHPVSSAATLVVFVVVIVGIAWIIDGIMSIVESKSASSRGLAITYGIIGIVAGLAVVSVPAWSVVWLLVFCGLALLVLGCVGLARAFTFGRGTLTSL